MGKLAKMKLAKSDHPLLQERWNMSLGELTSTIAARAVKKKKQRSKGKRDGKAKT